ncbi:MAG: hypothetical protein IKM81_10770 [Fibrobacter sp.]|nr:hypothetical protein [Fibrobacter sp.]
MKRINTPTATQDRKFRDGNRTTGLKATQFSAEWCNDVQEELCNIIEILSGHGPTGESQSEAANAILRRSVKIYDKSSCNYALLKNDFANGGLPVVVDAGTSGNVSSKRFYLPDANSIDLRTPSQNAGVFRFFDIDVVEKKVRILVYSEGSETPAETVLGLDYSGGLVTKRVGTKESTTDLASGFFLNAANLLLSNQYNEGGSAKTKKVRIAWDDSAHDYDILVDDGNIVLGTGFPKVLFNKWMSGCSNDSRVGTTQNEAGVIAIAREINELSGYYADEIVIRPGSVDFYSSKDGAFKKVNQAVLQNEPVDSILTVDGTTSGKVEWMKAQYWQLGQTRKVKNVSGSSVVVSVTSAYGESQEITFRNNRYREFICVGFASSNLGADTLAYLLPGDNY